MCWLLGDCFKKGEQLKAAFALGGKKKLKQLDKCCEDGQSCGLALALWCSWAVLLCDHDCWGCFVGVIFPVPSGSTTFERLELTALV